jgi:hypothetical protein
MNTEIFRNRFKKHDAAFKEILKEIKPTSIYRKKRNYQEAFLKDGNPPQKL